MNDERTHWSLVHTGHHVVCTQYPAPVGTEVRVSYNDLPIAVQRYTRAEDAAEWAEQVRSQWEQAGTTAAVPAFTRGSSDGANTAEAITAVATADDRAARPFVRELSKSHTPLNASATSPWFGLEYAWRAFC